MKPLGEHARIKLASTSRDSCGPEIKFASRESIRVDAAQPRSPAFTAEIRLLLLQPSAIGSCIRDVPVHVAITQAVHRVEASIWIPDSYGEDWLQRCSNKC